MEKFFKSTGKQALINNLNNWYCFVERIVR
jgi:hypothetical protein